MNRTRTAAFIALLAVTAAACERTPVGPIDDAEDFALAILGTDAATRPGPHTLPGLLQSAVHRTYTEQGNDAARALVAKLSQLQEAASEAVRTGDAEGAAGRARAVEAEELRIVLAVFGGDIAARVVGAVEIDAARLRDRLSTADGTAAERVRQLLREADESLRLAAGAVAAQEAGSGLFYGTRAAALVEAARLAYAESLRLPGLDELYRQAVASIAEGSDARLSAALAKYQRLQLAAQEAVRSGDRQRAYDALETARDEQVAFVLRVLGPGAVRGMLGEARAAAPEVQAGITAARAAGRDVSRMERMAAAARDMLGRAQTSFTAGDHAAALDLGSHAVSLTNALRLTLARF